MNTAPTAGTSAPSTRPALDVDRLVHRLGAVDPDVVTGLRVEVVDEAASTNALVAERARTGEPEGLVVVAEHQTAGRGRLDRSWQTPPRSGLTLSLLLRPTAPVAAWPWLPLLAGYAVDKALRAAGFEASVKWPNDVMLDDRKVAGILSEVVDGGATDVTGDSRAVVVGIGVNVGMTTDELPVPTATSLLVAGGDEQLPDRTDLLVGLLESVWESYATWQAGGEPGARRLAESYAAACATLGSAVRVDVPAGDPVTGRATGVDASGRLLVQTPDGERAVGAGDVVHVRPA